MFKIIPQEQPPGLELIYISNRPITQLEAWQVTLLKWQTLLENCQNGRLVADGGVKTCALCALYYYGHSDECEDCPIQAAGYPGCRGTPYEIYRQAVERGDLEDATHAAQRELVFLRRLAQGE